jgi:uncharacterized membrane protein YraQ (UPF0718 family)
MSDCCQTETKTESEQTSACCGPSKARIDWILWISAVGCIVGAILHFVVGNHAGAGARYGHAVTTLLSQMWWGLALGIFVVGLIERIPREVVAGVLGPNRGAVGIARAMLAGLALDLCNHGILLVAMSLYRRGASLGQTFAFLVASPWNSLALTLILVSLIGLPWTLLFVAGSGAIAFATGLIVESLVKRGLLPENPNRPTLPENFRAMPALKSAVFSGSIWNPKGLVSTLRLGLRESRMILRWLFFGVVLAALIQAFVPADAFKQWFAPTLAGLGLTLVAATIIEVCSEGSTPIAADLFTRAGAPGNAFAFLMAGAATDYTEIVSLKETTGRWTTSLMLPLLTVPQVVALSYVMNVFR